VSNLSAFVKGVKELGLWSDMVCWPLRSSQNAGTGTTAYSLGGLGTHNGTLVNGPTWGADGVFADGATKRINLPDQANIYNARSGMFVFRSQANDISQALINIEALEATGYYVRFFYDGSNANGTPGLIYSATRNGVSSTNSNDSRTTTTDFVLGSFTADDSTDNVFRNGNLETLGARAGLSAINPTGARSFRAMFWNSTNMTAACAMLSTAKWSDTQVTALHNLYRATLGTGLSLP
jgi:hypothetical protein